ncbi:serine hydrolase domain-containing protein [Kitasatospora sp. NPDC058965]|uniref:serine hydrolase domain-containing protein n=1 Tax=Kitasatospora sp. NPDC058965 TaxID=3346682 RepID=UPI0036907D22
MQVSRRGEDREPPFRPGRGTLATPDSRRLDRLLRPLFQGLPPTSGIAVAVVRGEEHTVACRGFTDPAAQRPVRADSRFELGSITKTFTALLLAEMVARGEVRYDDPIDAYLPAGAVPGYPKERPITLLHLATHTSGLPRLPFGLQQSAASQWFTRPCATFGVTHLLRALSRTPVRGTPGTQVRYSSLGSGLLGLLLENAAGTRYEDLLASRVCQPLGMVDTSCGAGDEGGGSYRRGRRVPSFRFATLPGASALRSSADDMLRYLQALIAADRSWVNRLDVLRSAQGEPVDPGSALRIALSEVRRPRAARRTTGTRLCLGWKQRSWAPVPAPALVPLTGRVQSPLLEDGPEGGEEAAGFAAAADLDGFSGGHHAGPEPELLFHEGGTRDFLAFAGFAPAHATGMVALISGPPQRRRRYLQTVYDTVRGLCVEELS